jgi:PilZ domain-containing protein
MSDEQEKVPDDRRNEVRFKTYKRGLAIFNDGWSTFSCLIRELSEQGAKLSINPQSNLPEHFRLMIVNDKIIIPVARAWRRGDKVGVKFEGSSRRTAQGASKQAARMQRSA